MPRRTPIAPELTRGAFTLDQARRAGLTRAALRTRAWRRIGPSTYEPATVTSKPIQLLHAAARRLPSDAVFSGYTAAWLHGLELPPLDPIEATLPAGRTVSARAGTRLHRADVDGDVVLRRSLRVTTLPRTLLEIARTRPLVDAVVAADLALHSRLVTLDELVDLARRSAGRPGVVALRRIVHLVDPSAESQMESRLRVLLVLGGLPRPLVQVDLHDRRGDFLGRVDLYYPAHRLALEYDGAQHRDRLAEDNRRQNRLLAAGYRLLRFTAADVLGAPRAVVAQVAAALV